MRNDLIVPGMEVTTTTTSGQEIVCTVIKRSAFDAKQWLLCSPTHGYVVTRRHSEINPYKETKDGPDN